MFLLDFNIILEPSSTYAEHSLTVVQNKLTHAQERYDWRPAVPNENSYLATLYVCRATMKNVWVLELYTKGSPGQKYLI